jgi:HAE1 family hydrophobic/amphiphilic exporter-1
MSLMRQVVNKPTTVLIISSLLFLLGIFMTTLIPQQFMPDFDYPIITVSTTYEGAAPEEVENSISKIMESTLLGIAGIENISSTSSEGLSTVALEFSFSTNLDEATNDIRDKLDLIRDSLPDDADSPVIYRFDINASTPVLFMTLTAPGLDADDLKPYAEDMVQPLLEQIDGVSSAQLMGGRDQQIRIDVIQNRLDAYDVTMSEVNQAVAAQNLQLGAGSIYDGDRRLLLRTDGTFKSVDEVANSVITYRSVNSGQDTTPILLRDIAEVYLGYEDSSVLSQLDGEGVFVIMIYKTSDANIVQVAGRVMRALNSINEKLPNNMQLNSLWNGSTYVKQSLSQVSQSVALGAFFSVLILIVFLRSVKSALIVSITMPLSILTTLMLMYYFDLTLNVMSLAGLNLGVGMITDSGIVILENITRYREKGVSQKTSAILGSQEMITAIMASTLTTVSVFLPMVVFGKELGIAGVIFNDLSFTVVISLMCSLAFAMTLVPVLAGVYLPVTTTKQRSLKGLMLKIDTFMAKFLDRLDERYSHGIKFALDHRRTIILTVFGSLLIAFVLLGAGFVSFEFMPQSDAEMYQLEYKLPEGSTDVQTAETGQQMVASLVRDLGVGVQHVMLLSGVNTSGANGTETQNMGTIFLFMPPFKERTLSGPQVSELVRGNYDQFPGVEFNLASMSGGGGGGGSTGEISIDISSNSQDDLMSTANTIVEILKEVPQLREPASSLDEGLPQIELKIERAKAYSLGLNVATIANELKANIDGTTIGRYSLNGKDIDIYTQLQEGDRKSVTDLDNIFVKSSLSQEKVAISNIATVEQDISPVSIFRKNQTRQISVTATAGVDESGRAVAVGDANTAAWNAINRAQQDGRLIMPDGLMLSQSGDIQELVEVVPKLLGIMLVAILLVYGVMASQFESLKDPFIIILSIATLPLGPIVLYMLTRTSFSVFSIVGFIMLVGIVVNNGIILVDYTNLLRRRGMKLYEAIVQAGRNRLRPILMTTSTTVLGMLPMALSNAEGSEMTQVVGITVLGGMIVSSIMTLFLVPTLYLIFNRKDEAKRIAEQKALEERLFGRASGQSAAQ